MSPADDSAALEREFEEAARRRRRTTRAVSLGVLGLALLPFAWYALQLVLRSREEAAARAAAQLTTEERTEAEQLLAQAERALKEADAEFGARMTPEALAQIKLDEDGSECPYRLVPPTLEAAHSYVLYGSIDMNYFGSLSYTLREPGEPIGESSTVAVRRYLLQRIGEALRSGRAEKPQLRELRELASVRGTSIVVLVENRVPAAASSSAGLGVSYTAGRLTGRAYLYSFAQKRIACAGLIEAVNSPKLDIRFSYTKGNVFDKSSKQQQSAEAALERDMEVQIRRALAAGLHAVAAPAAAADSAE
ncbi:MAG: hypothetical protein U1A78_25445 [Polyangia bacterium]